MNRSRFEMRLAVLAECSEQHPKFTNELTRKVNMNFTTLTQILASLIQRNFIKRGHGISKWRRKQLTPTYFRTPAGTEFLQQNKSE